MNLEQRLSLLVSVIGSDIKDVNTRLEGGTFSNNSTFLNDLKVNGDFYIDSNKRYQEVIKKTYSCYISLTSSGTFSLFKTPSLPSSIGVTYSGGRFVPTNIWFEGDGISGLGFDTPNISIGWSASSYSEFVDNQNLPNVSWEDYQFIEVGIKMDGNTRKSVPNNTDVIIKVNTPSDANEYSGNILIEGYYTPIRII